MVQVAVRDGGFNTFDDGDNSLRRSRDLFLHDIWSNQDGVVMAISIVDVHFVGFWRWILTKTFKYWALLDSCSSARAANSRMLSQ